MARAGLCPDGVQQQRLALTKSRCAVPMVCTTGNSDLATLTQAQPDVAQIFVVSWTSLCMTGF